MLDEGMLLSLMELPDQYNYGMYSKFINDYGTHYVTSGSMGGIYEYILVIDEEKMESEGKCNVCFLHSGEYIQQDIAGDMNTRYHEHFDFMPDI